MKNYNFVVLLFGIGCYVGYDELIAQAYVKHLAKFQWRTNHLEVYHLAHCKHQVEQRCGARDKRLKA